MSDLATRKISFFQKNDTQCPVCGEGFKREELLTGGGRMIAGKLGEDLRRHYEPSKKFGDVFPIIYYVTTCPHCYYSATNPDFVPGDPKAMAKLATETDLRKKSLLKIFPDLDFLEPRRLQEGAAGYFLSIMCYQHWTPSFAPSLKQGICSLRAAWIFGDLHRKYPGENYDYLEKIFLHKARFYYMLALEREQSGQESVGNMTTFGPDVDNNYGYEGVMYLAGYLEFHFGEHYNEQVRAQSLGNARRAIARIVGLGKSSKSKPSVLLDMARELHKQMGEEIK